MSSTVDFNLFDNDPSSSASDEDPAQKYLDHIEEMYKEAEELIDLIAQYAADVAKDESAIRNLQSMLDALEEQGYISKDQHDSFDFANYSTVDEVIDAFVKLMYANQSNSGKSTPDIEQMASRDRLVGHLCVGCNEALADLHDKGTKIEQAQKQLEEIDPGMKGLDDTIQEIMHMFAGSDCHARGKLLEQDLQAIEQYFKPIFEAMKDRLKADEAEAIIKGARDQNLPLSEAELGKLYQQAVDAESAESSVLSGLEDQIGNDVRSWDDTSQHASAELAKYNWYHTLKTFGSDRHKKAELRRVRENANMMKEVLEKLLKSISPEIATTMPGFTELQLVLDSLMDKIEKILKNKDLSPEEKKKAVLFEMMIALSLLSQILMEVTKDKSALDKRCATALQQDILGGIDRTEEQAEKLNNLRHAAKEMEKFMTITKWVMTATFMLLSPNPAALLAMGAITALEETKVMDKYVTKPMEKSLEKDGLSSDKARILSEVITALIEAAVVAGACAFDGPEKGSAEAADETAIQVAKEAMEEALAREAANPAATQEAIAAMRERMESQLSAVEEQIQQVARQARTSASRVAWRQNPLAFMKGLLTGNDRTAVELAMKNAAQDSRTEAIVLFREAARTGDVGTNLAIRDTEEIANQAAARALKVELKVVEEENMTFAKASSLLAYYEASHNTIEQGNEQFLNGIADILAKMGVHEDEKKKDEIIKILAMVMQAIIAMGAYSSIAGPQLGQNTLVYATRAMGGAQVFSQGTQVWVDASLAQNADQQAHAIPKVTASEANVDAFQLLLQRLFQEQKKEQDEGLQKQEQISQSNYTTSLSLEKSGDVSRIISSAV